MATPGPEERAAALHKDPDEPTQELDAVKPETNGAVPEGSLLDQIVQRRDEIARETTADFPLDIYDGLIVVTYRLLPFKQLRQLAGIAVDGKGGPDRELVSACETLSAACVEVWMQDPESGERNPWPGRDPEVPVRYDFDLARYLRIDLPENAKVRDVIRAVFQRDLAVTTHWNELLTWMRGANREATEEFAKG